MSEVARAVWDALYNGFEEPVIKYKHKKLPSDREVLTADLGELKVKVTIEYESNEEEEE